MKEFGGWQFPDGETHLPEWLAKQNQSVEGRLAYQYKKIAASLQQCRGFRRAIDVGGHVGLWSFYLASKFQAVEAFEPVADHRHCFAINVSPKSNVRLYGYALGEEPGTVSIHKTPSSSGDSYVEGTGDIEMAKLDTFEFPDVDFIKLDCEGYELFALRGGEETIKRCLPTICCEQKPGKAQKFRLGQTDAVKYLESVGYKIVANMSGDYIMVPA